jgi:hypothetical protein
VLKLGKTHITPPSNLTLLPVNINLLFHPNRHNGTLSFFQTTPSNLCQQLILLSFARFCYMPKYGSTSIHEVSGKVYNYVQLTSLVAEVTYNKIMVLEVTIYIVPDFSIEQGQTMDAHKKDSHCCILGIMFPSDHTQILKGDSFTT